MKTLLNKTDFPKAPGGDRYEWKSAETKFSIPKNGKYIIEITASAKNAAQNHSTDDDDLRIALDHYDFGKYEVHKEKISWKGFGTASSWDGASLKGNSKTITFFVELQKGEHTLQFFADNKPTLEELKISQLEKDEPLELRGQQPPSRTTPNREKKTDRKGTPWMSFVFLGVKPKLFSIEATAKSAAQKKSTDGDNLKIVVNGKIVTNPKAPHSKKYKNFYFSGDLSEGKTDTLALEPKEFEFLEDSVELWYDENPSVTIRIEFLNNIKEWGSKIKSKKTKLKLYEFTFRTVVSKGFEKFGYQYSKLFLNHSLTRSPRKLRFESNSRLAKKIKRDQAYEQIVLAVKDSLRKGILNGQIMLGDEKKSLKIDFQKGDLKLSLHGLKKIEFQAWAIGKDNYKVELNLLDVYDFDAKRYDKKMTWPFLYMADELEKSGILKNFEIEIDLSDILKI